MPRLDDDERTQLLERGEEHARRLFHDFVDFAFNGNILEIAVGLILASAFTELTTSFVSDILLPPIAVILPLNRNIDEKFAVLKAGPKYGDLDGYTTLAQAQLDGAVVLAYGVFINKCVNFLGVGLSLYLLARVYQCISPEPIIKHTVKCRYCKKEISDKVECYTYSFRLTVSENTMKLISVYMQAVRCVNCTSWLDGREERMH
ncbi:gated mechanosensitive channel [Apiospora hydei]|uniref:Gated mechanosensitive channel n=1 Tax=Apiospora hydei TaxID=1337664 RepID=A0ABR1W8P4_9PEZI